MSPKRLVLLVEGEGDVDAVRVLVKRLLSEYSAFDAVSLDEKPLRIGGYSKIRRSKQFSKSREHDFGEWRRHLQNALKRPNVGGCILLLDGDSPVQVEGEPFCAMRAARLLASEARKVGAGKLFSVAIVFVCMEFESWLIAGIESLLGKPFSDGRNGMPSVLPKNVQVPANPELAPRDAKGWLRRVMATGYGATRDQAELARLVDLSAIRGRKEIRSFRRMESAIGEIVAAIRSGNHVATPCGRGG